MPIVEGSPFVAVPLGGMTMAQLGAGVIRFDPILVHDRYDRVGPALGYRSHSERSREDAAT